MERAFSLNQGSAKKNRQCDQAKLGPLTRYLPTTQLSISRRAKAEEKEGLKNLLSCHIMTTFACGIQYQ